MKTLYLVRHAKSSHDFDLEDHQRPLADRGLNDAPLVAEQIKDNLKMPDRIISSDAVRAKTTAVLFLKTLEIDQNDLILEPKLYDFNGREVEKIIRAMDDRVNTLMIFGHNNAMTSLVNNLGDMKIDNVATAGFTQINFDQVHWKDISDGTTENYVKPKQLK